MQTGTQDANQDLSSQEQQAGNPPDPSTGDEQNPSTEAQETSAETLNTEQEGQEEGQEQQQQQQEEVPFHNHPRWKEVQQERETLRTQVAEMQANLQNIQTQAQFYAQQYNDMMAMVQGHQPGQPQPGQQQQAPVVPQQQQAGPTIGQGIPPLPDLGALPQGITGPEEWESQEQQAKYIDHRSHQIAGHVANHVANQAVTNFFRSQVAPVLDRMSRTVTSLQDQLVRNTHKDYDEVVRSTWEDVFTLDPQGQILGVKNQALLHYLQQQPFPQLAAYQHGLNKKAPERIKQGVQNATRKAIQKLGTKPRGASEPKGGSGAVEGIGELDWETPPDQAEKILHKHKLI